MLKRHFGFKVAKYSHLPFVYADVVKGRLRNSHVSCIAGCIRTSERNAYQVFQRVYTPFCRRVRVELILSHLIIISAKTFGNLLRLSKKQTRRCMIHYRKQVCLEKEAKIRCIQTVWICSNARAVDNTWCEATSKTTHNWTQESYWGPTTTEYAATIWL